MTALAFAYSALIAVAVVAAGWHRPSDVVGAMLVAAGAAATVTLVAAAVDRHAFAPRRRSTRTAVGGSPGDQQWPARPVSVRYLLIAAGLLAVGTVAAVLIAALNATQLQVAPIGADFVMACASMVALTALMLAVLLSALRRSFPEA